MTPGGRADKAPKTIALLLLAATTTTLAAPVVLYVSSIVWWGGTNGPALWELGASAIAYVATFSLAILLNVLLLMHSRRHYRRLARNRGAWPALLWGLAPLGPMLALWTFLRWAG